MKKINKFFLKQKSIPLDIFLDKVLYDKNIGYFEKTKKNKLCGDGSRKW